LLGKRNKHYLKITTENKKKEPSIIFKHPLQLILYKNTANKLVAPL